MRVLSAPILYPNGYGNQMITIETMMERHGAQSQYPMLQEFDRRVFNWIASTEGQIGIGGGWRVKPHPVSHASMMGWSFHQYQLWLVGQRYAALDLVARNENGDRHRAPYWSEVPRQGSEAANKWGVHCNIDSESWHMQPIEIDGFRTWVNMGRPELFNNYPIPRVDNFPIQVSPPVGMPAFDPAMGLFSLWPINPHKPRIADAAFVQERVEKGYDNWTNRGDAVKYLQGVIKHKAGGGIMVDGHYGPLSEGRVIDLQTWFKLEVDGLVGPQVWTLIDALSAA